MNYDNIIHLLKLIAMDNGMSMLSRNHINAVLDHHVGINQCVEQASRVCANGADEALALEDSDTQLDVIMKYKCQELSTLLTRCFDGTYSVFCYGR